MRIVFLGPPGSGKGTQASVLAQRNGWQYISTGDLLRRLVDEQDPKALEAKAFMDRGDLVPDGLMVEILLGQQEGGLQDGLILDGFPRTHQQAEVLDAMLSRRGNQLDAAVLINVGDEEVLRRLLNRSSCQACGAIFNQRLGFCPSCGTEIQLRSDDNVETIRKRLTVYHQQIDPLLRYYEAQKKLHRVDGRGDPEVVGMRIRQSLGIL
jgi:adenylate kinase